MSFLKSVRKKYPSNTTTMSARRSRETAKRAYGSGRSFMFATGIECSYPKIEGGIRRDEMEECGHYERWHEDFHLVKKLGISNLRYGIPYYKVHVAPERYDWSVCDEPMQALRKLGITPILDLLHFGVPDWIGDFQNPDLPVLFSQYAGAVAERYPWVRFYTPINEMHVTARGSTLDGVWNERIRTDRAYVTATKHVVAANTLATHEIVNRRSNAVFVQSETAEYTHNGCAEPNSEIELKNESRLIAADLLYGAPSSALVLMYLFDNGLTRDEYEWFQHGEPKGFHVIGCDYYGRNERVLRPDGSWMQAEDVLGWRRLCRVMWERYKKPVMYTETNVFNEDDAPKWLWKQWMNVLRIRADGVPVLGFTWYSLTDQIDWDVQLAQKRGVVNACGLYDLERKPRPVAASYKMIIDEFEEISLAPEGELFTITEAPARQTFLL